MKTGKSRSRGLVGQILIYTLILNGFMGLTGERSQVRAQKRVIRVIIVNAEQPNVWTLEQAHYLLAQMHRRNLDLKAKSLEELDPNEINGLRFEILRQLIEFGATFNQADQFTNQILAKDKTANAERRRALTAHRDKLHDESLELTRQISQLKIERARATSQEDKGRLDSEIAARTTEQEKVDKEIEFDDKELKTLGDSSGEIKATTGGATFNAEKLPTSVFEKAFEDAMKQQLAEFNKAPKLNATLRLENFLQMQYEIIAKQLALLRDEVGPGERLLFLEMPQTVNATHHEADKKWAQSWWRIAGYIRNCDDYNRGLPKALQSTGRSKGRCGLQVKKDEPTKTGEQEQAKEEEVRAQAEQEKAEVKVRMNRNSPPEPTSRRTERIWHSWRMMDPRERITDLEDGDQYVNLRSAPKSLNVLDGEQTREIPLNDRTVRTVELIPRQSSLNVNDMKLQTHAGAFNFALSTLFGFGSSLNVQRQREQFSQFVQQELYSAAFGKGSLEFGWTFTPMPGTDRLLSGVRTTYAVVVVPQEASYLVLESNGCYFPRSQYQPNDFTDTLNDRWIAGDRTSRNCGDAKAFFVPIPVGSTGQNNFFVEGLSYQSVGKGERIVVSAYGYNFSSQLGVLVNGSPLTQSIGLAQPLLRDDSTAGTKAVADLKEEKVHGRIERVDSEQIVFSFEMLPDFEGTPAITLIAPGKAITVNQLDDLYINGEKPASLGPTKKAGVTVARWMFGKKPAAEDFKIDSVEIFSSAPGRLSVLINGEGFSAPAGPATPCELFVNGVAQPCRVVSHSLLVSDIPAPRDGILELTITNGNNTEKLPPRPNPAYFKVESVSVVSYEQRRGRTPGALVVRIGGSGFTTGLRSMIGQLVVTSTTEATLTILNPSVTVKVTLYDRWLNADFTTVIRRPPPN